MNSQKYKKYLNKIKIFVGGNNDHNTLDDDILDRWKTVKNILPKAGSEEARYLRTMSNVADASKRRQERYERNRNYARVEPTDDSIDVPMEYIPPLVTEPDVPVHSPPVVAARAPIHERVHAAPGHAIRKKINELVERYNKYFDKRVLKLSPLIDIGKLIFDNFELLDNDNMIIVDGMNIGSWGGKNDYGENFLSTPLFWKFKDSVTGSREVGNIIEELIPKSTLSAQSDVAKTRLAILFCKMHLELSTKIRPFYVIVNRTRDSITIAPTINVIDANIICINVPHLILKQMDRIDATTFKEADDITVCILLLLFKNLRPTRNIGILSRDKYDWVRYISEEDNRIINNSRVIFWYESSVEFDNVNYRKKHGLDFNSPSTNLFKLVNDTV